MPLADWPNYPGNNPPPDQNTFLTWDFHSPQLMETPENFILFLLFSLNLWKIRRFFVIIRPYDNTNMG